MKFIEIRKRFRARLQREEILAVPGVFDALSAKWVERAGFEAVHVGSFSVAASLGLPDVGLLNHTEISRKVREVASVVGIPVIADAEDGFVDAAGIGRVIDAFEQAGAGAIHIEDHVSGKHTSAKRVVVSVDDARQKIQAAVASRQDPNFMIIGRTDVTWATGRVEDTVERLVAFARAGADAVMPLGLNLAQLRDIRNAVSIPIVIVNAADAPLAEEQAAGARISLYHSFCVEVASNAMRIALERFGRTPTMAAVEEAKTTHAEMESLLGYAEYDLRRRHFLA